MSTVNSKIDENENMAYAKKNTMEAFGSAKSYMSGLFGWDQGKEQDDS